MNGMARSHDAWVFSTIALIFLLSSLSHPVQSAGPLKSPSQASLPANLFVTALPANAIDVKAARESARQGSPIVLRGRIGGDAAPFAQNHAIFLISDTHLPTCAPRCSCPTPWDSCCAPREVVVANLATIQVADETGKPLRANLNGVNGLSPLAEVVILGTVARKDNTNLLVTARQIYVKPGAK